MTSLHWQTSLQNRQQCHALCMLGKTTKWRLGLATFLSFGADMVHCPMQVGTVGAWDRSALVACSFSIVHRPYQS